MATKVLLVVCLFFLLTACSNSPPLSIEEYAEECGKISEALPPPSEIKTWGNLAQAAQSAYQTQDSLVPPIELEVFHESLVAVYQAIVEEAQQHSPDRDFTQLNSDKVVDLVEQHSYRDYGISDSSRKTLEDSGCY